MPAIDISTHVQMLKVEDQFGERCISMMGVHPCSVKENYKQELKVAEEYFQKRSFIGVGETGLDFYWDVSLKNSNTQLFRRKLN